MSTGEQIGQVITDSDKKKDELISLGNQLMLKDMLKMMLMFAREAMKGMKRKAKKGNGDEDDGLCAEEAGRYG